MTVLGGDPHVKASVPQIAAFFGIAVPIVSAYVLSWSRMKELRQYNPIRLKSELAALAYKIPLSARSKQFDVNALLERVSYNSHVNYWVSHLRGRVKQRQEKLQSIFENATPDELNHLLRSTNFPQLLQYGDLIDSFIRGRVKSIDHLGPLPKAVAMHALMKINTIPFHHGQQEWIRTLFMSTNGDELTVLKMHLDGTTDYNNLFKMLFTDITDLNLRNEILHHLTVEGEKVAKLNESKHLSPPLKILSDVDDTLWCSGGRWPAGVDTAYPRHTVYPGALAFYEELDIKGFSVSNTGVLAVPASAAVEETSSNDFVKVVVEIPHSRGGGTAALRVSTSETVEGIQTKVSEQFKIPPWNQKLSLQPAVVGSVATNARGHNLVFLSARPHAFKDLTESSTYKRFQHLFDDGRMHTHPTLLAGNLRSGAAAVWGDVSSRMRQHLHDAIKLSSALFLSLDEKLKRPAGLESFRKRAEQLASEDSVMEEDPLGVNGNWEPVGRFKATTFERFAILYPECSFVFVGDDGQGDVLAAEAMFKRLGGTPKRPAALIHRVLEDRRFMLTSVNVKDADEREKVLKELGIRFFDTFVGAATIMMEAGLVQPRVVHRVGVVAKEELIDLILEHPQFHGWEKAVKVMNADIERANEAIKKAAGGHPRVLTIEAVHMPF